MKKYTLKQLAKISGISERTLYRQAKKGLPFDANKEVRHEDLVNWLRFSTTALVGKKLLLEKLTQRKG